MEQTPTNDGRRTIRDWAEDDRPREKLLTKGPQALSNAELIAVLIRAGSARENAVDLAKRILTECGDDLATLARSGVHDLRKFKGMGDAKAITILAALELGRRRRDATPGTKPLIATSAHAYEALRGPLADLPHEEFWLLLLDRGNRLIKHSRVSIGGLHGTVADPKVIFKRALEERASSVVLCHNHPSGQLRPSEEDLRLTRKLVDGGRLLDIVVQDHLILTADGYFSFADHGML
jgi:DNA repair protein RadC